MATSTSATEQNESSLVICNPGAEPQAMIDRDATDPPSVNIDSPQGSISEAKVDTVPIDTNMPHGLESPPQSETVTVEQTGGEKTCEVWQPPQYTEHPEGVAIRRQVEFYFSDENLPNDDHLLSKTGGSQNLLVTIKHICGFARMRKYKPYRSVVESLKKSTFLDVVDDKYLQRKIPLEESLIVAAKSTKQAGDEVVQKPAKEQESAANRAPAVKATPLPAWTTKAMKKPTGFEEYWTDAPVTPEVYAVEQDLYDSEISFRSRIETALSRYSRKRKFHQNTALIFNKFMKYGGINSGQKQFNGLDPKDLEGRDAATIAAITATHAVSDDIVMDDDDKWVVDFEGVAKGFLSSQELITYLRFSTSADVKVAVNILRNFYNYLLHHDVCPEYAAQIHAARRICDLAGTDLLNTIRAEALLPGDFNSAVSRLHGGTYAGIFSVGQTWDGAENLGGSEKDSQDIMMAAISAHGTEEQFRRASESTKFEVIYEEDVIFEVISVDMPDSETDALYEAARNEKDFLNTVGKLQCRRWTYPLARRSSRTDGGRDRPFPGQTFSLFIEDQILEHCFVGMKLEGVVKGLDVGIFWLDRVFTVSPSYFELLPNEFWGMQKAAMAEEAAGFGEETAESGGRLEEGVA